MHVSNSQCAPRVPGVSPLARFALLALVLLALPACVPHVKFDEAVNNLNIAQKVNLDLERKLREAQLGRSDINGDLREASARMQSLEMEREALNDKIASLLDELDACRRIPVPTPIQDVAPGFQQNEDTGGIILENDVLFAPGKSVLRNESKAMLDQLVGIIQREYPTQFVFIDGHTDIDPIARSTKVNKDNWDLGAKRAHAVFDYFKAKGIAQERMVITSRGFAEPIRGVDVGTKAGKAECRRVEIRIRENSY